MARILMVWEMGAGNGHLDLLRAVAGFLLPFGHDIALVSANPRAAHRQFHSLGIPVYPAPIRHGSAGRVSMTDSYAQVLLDNGYANARGLSAAVRAWRDGIRRLRPDLMIADFAPTAMLAARLDGVKVAAVGQGYTLPPRRNPLPFLRTWETTPPPARLALIDAAATDAMNAALVDLGGRSVSRLTSAADLFDVRASFLCTFPELDHYPDRGDADYFGPIYEDSIGADAEWPFGGGPRVFAYAHSQHPVFASLLSALRRLGAPTLLYARGLAPGAAREGSTSSLRVMTDPVRLSDALRTAEAVVCQGIGTASAALVAGKPVLLMPEYLEQELTLHRIERQDMGIGIPPSADADTALGALRFVLGNAVYRARCAAFSAHYRGYTPSLASEAVANECHTLVC